MMSPSNFPLSPVNPISRNSTILNLIDNINKTNNKSEDTINSLAEKILTETKPERINEIRKMNKIDPIPPGERMNGIIADFKEAAVQKIDDAAIRAGLRKALNLIRSEKDIVSEFSQGAVKGGENACVCISFEAMKLFLSGREIRNEEDIHQLMQNGQKAYDTLNKSDPRLFSGGIVAFGEAFQAFKTMPGGDRFDYEVLLPEVLSPELAALKEALPPELIQIPGEVQTTFAEHFKELSLIASESNKTLCTAITCMGETLVAVIPPRGDLTLFDSHGRTYMNAKRGASSLKFANTDELAKHLTKLFEKATPPQYSMVILAGRANESEEKEMDVLVDSKTKQNPSEKISFLPQLLEDGMTLYAKNHNLEKTMADLIRHYPEADEETLEKVKKSLGVFIKFPKLKTPILDIQTLIESNTPLNVALKSICELFKLTGKETFQLIQLFTTNPKEGLPQPIYELFKDHLRRTIDFKSAVRLVKDAFPQLTPQQKDWLDFIAGRPK